MSAPPIPPYPPSIPKGSSGQIQFNSAGAFGGVAGLTWDGSNVSLTTRLEQQFGTGNVAVGTAAGVAIISGTNNALFGANAGAGITSGSYNVFLGPGAGQYSTTSFGSIAIGSGALALVGDGSFNIAIGVNALRSASGPISGTIAIGQSALNANTTGAGNLAIGGLAGQFLTDGNSNIAIGLQALSTGQHLSNCIAIGHGALALLDDTAAYEGNSTAIGAGVLQNCTSGSENVCVGGQVAQYLTTGVMNAGYGVQSLQAITTGSNNTGYGTSSLGDITTGNANTAVGHSAGYGVEYGTTANGVSTGDHCTFLGAFTTLADPTQHSYQTVIGAGAVAAVAASNNVTVGRAVDYVYVPSGVVVSGVQTVATLPAAAAELIGASSFVSDLSGSTYTYGVPAIGGGTRVGKVFCTGAAWLEG